MDRSSVNLGLTKDQLKKLLDTVFDAAVVAEGGHPLAQAATSFVKTLVDANIDSIAFALGIK